jgi:hypothetical protein
MNEHAVNHWNAEGVDEVFQFEEEALGVVSVGRVCERADKEGFLHHLPARIDINHARGEVK